MSCSVRSVIKAPAAATRPAVRIAAPVASVRFQKRVAVTVVRAAAQEASEDEPEFDMNADPRQQQRELRENKRQARKQEQGGNRRNDKSDGFEDKIIQLNRVTKVLKGGKLMKFRAVVVAGDRKGRIGYGCASAREVVDAVTKATAEAKANAIRVPMTSQRTFPHKLQVKEGAARIMLRPASEGTGVIAGGAVRVVLELAGYQNAFGKIYGTNSAMNNARGTIEALRQMRTWKQVANERGITIDYAMGRTSEPNAVASR